jgi:hypothetical protein
MWTDILKGGGKRIKINGDYLRQAIADYLQDTDYRDIYYKTTMEEDILKRYMAIKNANGERVGKSRLAVQLNSALMRYVPKGYTRQILTTELKKRLGVKGFKKDERIWLKDSVSQSADLKKGRKGKQAPVNSKALRTAIAEYVKETNYKDYYLKPELMEEIPKRYKNTQIIPSKRHAHLTTRESPVVYRNTLITQFEQFIMRYVPEGYKKFKLTVKLRRYLGMDENVPTQKMFWLKDGVVPEDINKIMKAKRLNSEVIRTTIAEYLEETGHRDYYFREELMEEIPKRYMEKRNSTKPSIVRQKLGTYVMRHIPKGYKKLELTVKLKEYLGMPEHVETQKKFWLKDGVSLTKDLRKSKEVEKLRTDSGERLRLKDWDEFKLRLRRMLNTEVPVNIYGRKSSVRIVDGPIVGNKAVIDISFRSLQGDRRYVNVNFIEEEGDYLFTNVEGDIQIPDTEIFNSEFKLRERITQMVVEELTFENEEQDLREKEEEELTEEENIRQLEAANPDSYWDREKGKLVQREVIPEDPPARDLNLEEAAKLGRVEAKREEDKQKNLARLRSLKNKLKNLSAHRGNRSRRDVP